MTLTTERLKWLHDAATELSATKLKMTMRPDELLVLTSELLANREAQPVAWSYEWASCITCEGPQNFQPVIEREAPPEWTIDEGQARNIIPLYAAPPAPVVPVVQHEPVVYMWDSERKDIDAPGYYRPEHLFFAENSVKKWGGRVVPLYTAPPAPAFPERLPCPVHLLPGLKFGKGVPTRSMLDALVRRAEYESEREAMTPEQKAEDDARIEAFKALLPRPPAPAVPGELLDAMEEVIRISDRDHEAWDKAKAAITACRAAMLNIWDLG